MQVEFNRMCAAAFAGSRFCTDKEVFETGDPPDAPAVEAWVHPVIVASLAVSASSPNTFTGLTLNPDSPDGSAVG
jgi:hypothetical protein